MTPLLEKYDVKVLLALNQALQGSKDFFRFLIEGGFPELAAFCSAIWANEEAMMWLFKNERPHFAILSNAIDGEEEALEWIKKSCTEVNYIFALACREDQGALMWLHKKKLAIFIMLAESVHKILDLQATENAGPYVMHFGGDYRVAEEMTEWLKSKRAEKINSDQ